jgi:uncharacterized membrane protein required for colicin V production
MTILDGLFLLLLLSGLWVGWWRGLIRGLFRIAVYLVALFVASKLAEPLGSWLNQTFGIQNFVRTLIERQLPPGVASVHVPPELVAPILTNAGVPPAYQDEILSHLSLHPVLDAIAIPYAHWLSTLLGLLLALTVLSLLLTVILAPLVRTVQLVVPRLVDRIGGMALGLILSLLELAFFALFLQMFTDLPFAAEGIKAAVHSSQLVPALSELAHALLKALGATGLLPHSLNVPAL